MTGMVGFCSVSIFQTLVATATVFMLVGTALHLQALREMNNSNL